MADILPLRRIDPPSEQLLVDARSAAALLGVGLRTLRTMDAAGRMPAPVRLSPGCVRWKLAELRDWIDAGCPDRELWEARRLPRK